MKQNWTKYEKFCLTYSRHFVIVEIVFRHTIVHIKSKMMQNILCLGMDIRKYQCSLIFFEKNDKVGCYCVNSSTKKNMTNKVWDWEIIHGNHQGTYHGHDARLIKA